ncbi:hemerythrin domain-containing protein [Actinoallomurus rhizosphaericola]|uniref:hemerythrin domain-containing protein n=1 Tax=Actinoallomurus rhizosphaericola TaxID=2952536 RepID=UPI002091DFD9|nr:hemerythrin domain-containing protein [Actinoallomurus rhizosphaericola]MCO5994318.1 hemerythrin domain-containing protein [Actinoallomurus rhizosphaericola]
MNRSENLISVLTEDHRDFEQLLSEVGHLTDFGRLRRSVGELMIAEMVRHAVAEETYLYPVARARLPQGQLIVEQEIAGHEQIEQILRDLGRPDLTDAEFSFHLSRLKAEAYPHAQAEEDRLFPLLARHLSEEELVDLGRKAMEAKEKASIRRYLADSDSSLRDRIVASGATLVERVRGYLRTGAYPL